MSFEIGNQELANLLVQAQVEKLQRQMETLNEEAAATRERYIEKIDRLGASILERLDRKGRKKAEEVRDFFFAQLSKRDRKEYSTHVRPAWDPKTLYYSLDHQVRYEEKELNDKIHSEWELVMANGEGEDFIGLSVCEVPVTSSARTTAGEKADWREIIALCTKVHALDRQIEELMRQKGNVADIERKVLARLTADSIKNHQDGNLIARVHALLDQPLLIEERE